MTPEEFRDATRRFLQAYEQTCDAQEHGLITPYSEFVLQKYTSYAYLTQVVFELCPLTDETPRLRLNPSRLRGSLVMDLLDVFNASPGAFSRLGRDNEASRIQLAKDLLRYYFRHLAANCASVNVEDYITTSKNTPKLTAFNTVTDIRDHHFFASGIQTDVGKAIGALRARLLATAYKGCGDIFADAVYEICGPYVTPNPDTRKVEWVMANVFHLDFLHAEAPTVTVLFRTDTPKSDIVVDLFNHTNANPIDYSLLVNQKGTAPEMFGSLEDVGNVERMLSPYMDAMNNIELTPRKMLEHRARCAYGYNAEIPRNLFPFVDVSHKIDRVDFLRWLHTLDD